MDQILEMQTFLAVADAGGFAAAADKLNISASVVSRRIKDLETRLGAQLIRRTTRQMNLTDTGQQFYSRAAYILTALEEAENEAGSRQTALTGTLKIAAPQTFGVRHLPNVLAGFMTAHPDLIVELDMSDRKVNLLDEGYDIAIRIGQLKDSSLKSRKLCDIKHVVAASADYWDEHGLPAIPQDLSGLPALIYSNSDRAADWPWRDAKGHSDRVRVTPVLSADNGEVLRDIAIKSLGVLCEPCFILHEAIESGALIPALTQYEWYQMGLYLVWPDQAFVPAKTRALIDHLVERFKGTPYWQTCLQKTSA